MYIDSHAHLFDKELLPDLDGVLRRAWDAGIGAIVVPGTNAETSEQAIELAERYDWVFACVGYHPHEAAKATDPDLARIEQLATHTKVVAIGEIGLDYHYDFSPRERQRRVFLQQTEIAVRMNLPVVVHTRDSIPDALDIARRAASSHEGWKGAVDADRRVKGGRGVFHCFTGSAEEAQELFSLGYTVSYPGIVTFKNSSVLETLRSIGYESILLETDAPYLTPVPYRGKTNEPSYLPLIANRIAEIFQTSPSVIAEQTTRNATRLFSLPE
ncbi:MAG: TatD family hydrolase [Ignavibacteriales bacterium]|nr:TatD family hydrolase [Ignavibacteriales bacterium]